MYNTGRQQASVFFEIGTQLERKHGIFLSVENVSHQWVRGQQGCSEQVEVCK